MVMAHIDGLFIATEFVEESVNASVKLASKCE